MPLMHGYGRETQGAGDGRNRVSTAPKGGKSVADGGKSSSEKPAGCVCPVFAGKLADHPNVVGIKEVETDLQHLEALVDEIAGKMTYLQTFRAYLTGLGGKQIHGGFWRLAEDAAAARDALAVQFFGSAAARLNRWPPPLPA